MKGPLAFHSQHPAADAVDQVHVVELGGERHARSLAHAGGRYTTDTLYRLVKGRLVEIGAGQYTAHALRASAACRVFEATGGDIARTMAITGHTSEKTLRTYIADANRERRGDKAIDAVQVMLDRREATQAARAA